MVYASKFLLYEDAAGSPHFAGMEEYDAPTLTIERQDTRLVFSLDGVQYPH